MKMKYFQSLYIPPKALYETFSTVRRNLREKNAILPIFGKIYNCALPKTQVSFAKRIAVIFWLMWEAPRVQKLLEKNRSSLRHVRPYIFDISRHHKLGKMFSTHAEHLTFAQFSNVDKKTKMKVLTERYPVSCKMLISSRTSCFREFYLFPNALANACGV